MGIQSNGIEVSQQKLAEQGSTDRTKTGSDRDQIFSEILGPNLDPLLL